MTGTRPELPDGFQLPDGFVLPDGVTEIPVIYPDDPDPQQFLPEVSTTMVFRHSDGVVWLLVHDEAVVYRIDNDTTYVLNPTSAIAWQCLDGRSTLEEILVDIADAFGVDLEQVRADFVPVAAQWWRDGLVKEVTDD